MKEHSKPERTGNAGGRHMNRRQFAKATLAGAGAAAARAIMGPTSEAEATREKADEMRKHIRTSDNPVQIDEKKYKRFDACDTAFNSVSREFGENYFMHLIRNQMKYVMQGKTCRDVQTGSVREARHVYAFGNAFNNILEQLGGDGTNMENRGPTNSWTPLEYTKPLMIPGPPSEKDPDVLTPMTKAVSRIAGADKVGISALNRNLIYASCQPNPDFFAGHEQDPPIRKPINFRKDVKEPGENDHELFIPDTDINAIAFAVEMPRVMVQTGAQFSIVGASMHGYARLGYIMGTLSEWIRMQGYWAIPAKNDTGANVPMAAEAGLGEAGRNGMLITPEWGPAVRLAKVLTNMPLHHDQPIAFGVAEFCGHCRKCARECPAQAITYGEKTWEGTSSTNAHGAYRWYNDGAKCLKDGWIAEGSTCAVCLATCPFTKGEMWPHELTKAAIKHAPALNGIWLSMDDAFGYGFWKERNYKDIFKYGVSTYGLDPKKMKKEFI